MYQTKKNTEYSNNDYRDYLEHSWGKKPEQKAREREYNHWYYINKVKDKVKDVMGYDERDDLNKKDKEYRDAQDRTKYYDKKYDEAVDYRYKVDTGEYFDKDRPEQFKKEADAKLRKAADDRDNAYDKVRTTGKAAREAADKYYKTPLGMAESFSNAGKRAISSILNKLKRK